MWLVVSCGAGIGALCRWQLTNWIKRLTRVNWPFATLIINWLGTFILGILVTHPSGLITQSILTSGFLGGLTTFSTMNVELITLWHNRAWQGFWTYLLASYAGGMVWALIGMII
ncbi:CrcB family protein [uncultured Limosilactobacillus sp.]|uniref:fluoride efflux transporter FluC n=1 Tax=uncultured Limosilactobacillus sp. TaxID=2837629 RepID=UPI0025F9E0E4|nr:CrcB family protein [uncultured Limosilactobacillus sp.]